MINTTHILDSINRKKANLFLVGAAKAGTTFIDSILSYHSKILMSPIKEPNFFAKDVLLSDLPSTIRNGRDYDKIERDSHGKIVPCHQLYIQSLEEYDSLFEGATKSTKYFGEASVSYLYSQVAAKEIYTYNPKAKIIIILRDPVERAFSHFLMDLKVGRADKSNFKEAVLFDYQKKEKKWGNSHLYVELGLYYNQVKRFVDLFAPKNILILDFSDLKNNAVEFEKRIYDFLELDPEDKTEKLIDLNAAAVPKNKLISFFLQLYRFKSMIKKVIPKSVISRIKSISLDKGNLPELTIDEYNEMYEFFKDDLLKSELILKLRISTAKNLNQDASIEIR